MKKIIIINGVNLNLLGVRETNIYGNISFEDFFITLQKNFPQCELSYFQSNIEGELINKLQEVGFCYDGIILNAIKAITTPVIEVHISNTFARETFRHKSFISPVAKGIILGFGLKGYSLAIESFLIN